MNGCYNCPITDELKELSKEKNKDKYHSLLESECDDCPYRL
jgi:hypothetical protein